MHYHSALVSEQGATDEWLCIHQKVIFSEKGWDRTGQNCTFKKNKYNYLHSRTKQMKEEIFVDIVKRNEHTAFLID